MQKMAWFGGSYGAFKVMGNATIRQSAYVFLFDFNRNHASILYRFRVISGYQSKVADFDRPHLHLAPPQGVTPVKYRGDLWQQKTRFPELSCGVVCVILRLAVLVRLRLVTDGCRHRAISSNRGCIASRGKKCKREKSRNLKRICSSLTVSTLGNQCSKF